MTLKDFLFEIDEFINNNEDFHWTAETIDEFGLGNIILYDYPSYNLDKNRLKELSYNSVPFRPLGKVSKMNIVGLQCYTGPCGHTYGRCLSILLSDKEEKPIEPCIKEFLLELEGNLYFKEYQECFSKYYQMLIDKNKDIIELEG